MGGAAVRVEEEVQYSLPDDVSSCHERYLAEASERIDQPRPPAMHLVYLLCCQALPREVGEAAADP